jgi:hypothetical protein
VTLVATFLGGAKSRLLPASIPFRFFGAAAAFHVLMWLVLVLDAAAATHFSGGIGPPLAAIHLLTLGVLTTTAIGASVQLLPVATRRGLLTVWPIKLVFWLVIPGLMLLVAGMYALQLVVLLVGAAAITMGLLVYALLLADNLRRATKLGVFVAYGWAALASLILAAGLGLALALDYQTGALPDHGAAALAHLILGGFGFMGLFALGFSHILVPMFALAAAPEKQLSFVGFGLAVASVTLGCAGALADSRAILTSAALVGLGAAAVHLWLMARVLGAGMRKRLGLSFVLVRAAWIVLPATPLVGLAALYQYAGRNGPALFGFFLLGGWLLTFLLGILQRIAPFLASMHANRAENGRPMLLSEIAAGWPLKVHAVCHGLALTGVGTAIAIDHVALLRAASGVGLVGATALAWFMADVLRCVFRASVQ